MIFSSPSFLWALGLLAIPIIIHLFQFRRYKQLLFPDISLLKEIQTQSQTKNQLRHLLILLSRLLILTAIVLAFAEPIIPASTTSNSAKPTLVSIYIDNSMSMQNESQNTTLLKQALQDAFSIVESYPKETQFQLITNDIKAESRRVLYADEVIEMLDNLAFTAKFTSLEKISAHHATQRANLDFEESVVYLLSDFSSLKDSLDFIADSSTTVRFINYEGDFNQNLSVDSAWISEPLVQTNVPVLIYCSVSNHGEELALDVPLEISVNDRSIATHLLTLEGNTSIDTTFEITFSEPGKAKIKASIDDQPIAFDNIFYGVLDVRPKLKVVEISENQAIKSPFRKLFSTNDFRFVGLESSGLVQDSLYNADLIILNGISNLNSGLIGIVKSGLKEGKNALIVLPKTLSESTQSLLQQDFGLQIGTWDTNRLEANRIELRDPIFNNVFESNPSNLNYPMVKGRWNMSSPKMRGLIDLFDGSHLLASLEVDRGQLYIVPTSLSKETTSFQDHALFVPAILNIALRSGNGQTLAHSINEASIILNRPIQELAKIKSNQSNVEFTPEIAYNGIRLNGQIQEAGFYSIVEAEQTTEVLAFNLSRTESSITSPESDAIIEAFEAIGIGVQSFTPESNNLASAIQSGDLDHPLWHWFVLIALLLLLTETALIKYFKT